MWIIEQPSSTARLASAAYSSGVYGIAGHWSRLATAPEIEQVMIAGFSKRAHTGITPCFLCGRSTRLVAAISNARITVGRVSRGSITSSISALPAAM